MVGSRCSPTEFGRTEARGMPPRSFFTLGGIIPPGTAQIDWSGMHVRHH